MSNTSRTDTLLVAYDMDPKPNTILEHARQLERDLNESENRVKQLEDHIDRLEQCGNSFFSGVTRDEAMKRWIQAKETKP